MAKKIRVYTDGACFPNPGMGGWGWTTLDGREASGGEKQTTNQRMEVTASLRAVEALWVPKQKLVVVTDSMYVINGATVWSARWLLNGWKNSRGNPVANRELWEEFLEVIKVAGPDVEFEWVKGHSGDPGNDAADLLATSASGASQAIIASCRKAWHPEEAQA